MAPMFMQWMTSGPLAPLFHGHNPQKHNTTNAQGASISPRPEKSTLSIIAGDTDKQNKIHGLLFTRDTHGTATANPWDLSHEDSQTRTLIPIIIACVMGFFFWLMLYTIYYKSPRLQRLPARFGNCFRKVKTGDISNPLSRKRGTTPSASTLDSSGAAERGQAAINNGSGTAPHGNRSGKAKENESPNNAEPTSAAPTINGDGSMFLLAEPRQVHLPPLYHTRPAAAPDYGEGPSSLH